MKTITISRVTTLAAAIGLIVSAGAFAADDTAVQTFNYEVQETAVIDVSGNPGAMIITAATPGSAPTPVQETSTSYSITNNAGLNSKKITAAINADTPAGVTLSVTLAPPANATSAQQALSTTAAEVVTGIDNVSETGLGITYDLEATAAAGKVDSTAVTVTFTITNT